VAVRLVTVIFLILCHLPVLGEVIEEVVAAVGPTPILRSDIILADLVQLVEAHPGENEASITGRLLDARINLELQYRELEESGTLYRLDFDVAATFDDLTRRGGGEQALLPELAANGLDLGDVEELALRLASASAYIEQRLAPRIRVTADDIEAAYQDLIVAEMEAAGQQPPPLDQVQEEIRRLLIQRKLNDEIEAWLDAAAENHEVTRFYRPEEVARPELAPEPPTTRSDTAFGTEP
jgi:hypothetical protein